MSLPIIVTIVFLFGLGAGIWFGFMLGFSKAMREAATKMQTTRSPVLGWGATGVGTVMLFIALGTGLYNWHFIRVARTATGIVTEMRTSQGHDGNDLTYAPVFASQMIAGKGIPWRQRSINRRRRFRWATACRCSMCRPIPNPPASIPSAKFGSSRYSWEFLAPSGC